MLQCLCFVGSCLSGLAQAQAPGAADANKSTLWYVPHTHWEGAVFKTREEYLDMGLAHHSARA